MKPLNQWLTDQEYLRKQQYRNADPLRARIAIHEQFGTNTVSWNEWIHTNLRLRPGMRVLEVGCGTGVLWGAASGEVPQGCEVTLCDLSMGMLRTTRQNARADGGFWFYLGDAQDLPFEEASFDLVIANHMLYHVPNLERALLGFKRVLTPDGTLFAATNGKDNMRELYLLLEEMDHRLGRETLIRRSDSGQRFGLESGEVILKEYFPSVERVVFDANLKVTAVEPLLAYIHSMWGVGEVEEDALRSIIQEEIDQQGYFFIGKSAGFLRAHAK